MPYLDKQSRIGIPVSLHRESDLMLSADIAICYNDSTKSLDICNKLNCKGKRVIAYRRLDEKGRFNIPLDAILLLGATTKDLLIFTLTDGQISISKA